MTDLDYKVVIPTAGIGSRLGDRCNNINKTLVSIAYKPIICYIVEQFSDNVPIVIALGYKGSLVRSFLELAYPERIFTFVEVDPYDGPNSGLGFSLLCCQQHLQCPFIFFTNDAIIKETIPLPNNNWIGYSDTPAGMDYRSIVLDSWTNNVVKQLAEKGDHTENPSYIGICGIKDHKQFWELMNDGEATAIKQGEAYGMDQLIQSGLPVNAIRFTWYDTGTIEALEYTDNAFKNDSDPHILPKQDEHIWFCKDKVIKFSINSSFIKKRVDRGENLKDFIPELLSSSEYMYSYSKVEGNVLSSKLNLNIFKSFLNWLIYFWNDKNISIKKFDDMCLAFYKEKTYNRVKKYFSRFNNLNEQAIINGKQIPSAYRLLEQVNWNDICHGKPVRFHGDLHFENVILTNNNEFVLLDWREDFAGSLEYGDIYYDFAKILHGIIVSHEIINKNHFIITQNDSEVNFDLHRKQSLVICEDYFEQFIVKNGYNWKTVKILTALIYLNIAPLHHDPYCHLLFNLGKYLLDKEIENDK